MYAKGLALLGLGMLAGAGALVDYWPTRGALPTVAPLTPRYDLARAGLAMPADLLSATVPSSLPARPAASDVRPLPVISVNAAAATAIGTPVTMAAPSSIASPAAPVLALAAQPAVPMVTARLIILPPLATPVSASAAWPADDEDSSLLDGARRTGASILRTTARTGASIFDAVRILGGTMRRALPN